MREARALFSPLRDEYAFGDFDEEGKGRIARFAAQWGHHADFDFMPAEDRVYFRRTAGGYPNRRMTLQIASTSTCRRNNG
jgi:hypothetical protein